MNHLSTTEHKHILCGDYKSDENFKKQKKVIFSMVSLPNLNEKQNVMQITNCRVAKQASVFI